MQKFKWVVDVQDYDRQRLDRSSAYQWKSYYGGLNATWKPKESMYQDELEDLEKVYLSTMKHVEQEISNVLPDLLAYMQEFISLHNQHDAISEKLDVLTEKMGEKEDE